MKKRPNKCARASALQITLSAAVISISAVFLASTFKAAPAASGVSAPIAPALEGDKNPASGSWTVTGSLNTGRGNPTATLLPNGKVLVAGGGNRFGVFTSAELYDPASGNWMATGSLNTARFNHTGTLLPDGKVLAAAGQSTGGVNYPTSAELYDPASGSWTFTGSLNIARQNHTATLLPNGKVLVSGGQTYYSGSLTSAELYDPASGSWTVTGNLNNGRTWYTATLLPDGKVLVAGGESVEGEGFGVRYLTTAELYDPASGGWMATGSLNTGRTSHTATLLPNGKVLVTGGYTHNGLVQMFLASAELYDPASGSWTATGSLNIGRYQHTATLLPNGKVLVSGGYNDNSGSLASAELYDPAGGTWTATGSLNTARVSQTATLLPNGKVLAATGYNNDWLTSAELYDTGETCSVCHKHTVTLSLACGSLEYRRHLDHGDTLGTCQSASEKK